MEKAIMKPATFPYMYQYRGGKKKKLMHLKLHNK